VPTTTHPLEEVREVRMVSRTLRRTEKRKGLPSGEEVGRDSPKFVAVMNETDAVRRLDSIDQSTVTQEKEEKKEEEINKCTKQ
jgi:hypothetical protein